MNIDSNFFDSMANLIYPSERQLDKANVSDTEASFLDLYLSISDGFVKTKNFDKRDDVDFDIVNFPFLDGDVPGSISYGVYISQNLFGLLEYPVMLMTLLLVIRVWQQNFSDKDIDIIKFVRRFLNFIGDILT